MAHELSIDPASGALRIAGIASPISAGQKKAEVASLLEKFARGDRDHGNGYQWLDFADLSFGGQACGLSLCFFEEKLVQANWGVSLPGAPVEDGWPTRAAIDDEIRFVRKILTEQLGPPFQAGAFDWGQVWSMFDPKGVNASHGIRYAPQQR